MREHQIVINLKREQFEEVQRLARIAGAKSVGAYLRERVLEFLETAKNGNPAQANVSIDGINLHDVSQDLARMHRELQVFIAESLSQGAYAQQVMEPVEPTLMDEAMNAFEELQHAVSQELQEHRQHHVSDTTFDITQKTETFLTDFGMAKPTQNLLPPTSPPTAANPANQSEYTNAVKYIKSKGLLGSKPPLEQPPQLLTNLANAQPVKETAQQPEPVKDDLEELADRAFAISPRLGALSNPPPAATERSSRRSDPLEDLLDDNIFEQAEQLKAVFQPEEKTVVYAPFADDQFEQPEEDVQYTIQVQPTVQPKAPPDEVPQPIAPFAESPALLPDETTPTIADQVQSDQAQTSVQVQTANTTTVQNDPVPPDNVVAEPMPMPDPSPPDDDLTPRHIPGDPNNISGGPPPKRRKK